MAKMRPKMAKMSPKVHTRAERRRGRRQGRTPKMAKTRPKTSKTRPKARPGNLIQKRYGPSLRPIGAPIHVSHGHHPHIPSISEPRRAQVGSKLAPSRAKMAYNQFSKTTILRGRGVKNHGFGEQLGPKGPNLTVQINRFDTRSEKKEYRIGNGRFKDWKWNV